MRQGTSYENTDGETNIKLSSTEVRGIDRVRNGNQVIGVSVTQAFRELGKCKMPTGVHLNGQHLNSQSTKT